MFAPFRRYTAGTEARVQQSCSIPHHVNGANRNNSAAKPTPTHPSDKHAQSTQQRHIVKKEAPMTHYQVKLDAKVEASFRTRLAALALSGCLAVATAVGPTWTQPYAP